VQAERALGSSPATLVAMTEVHWPEVQAIYQAGID